MENSENNESTEQLKNSENNKSTEQPKTENGSDSGDALLTDTNVTKPDGAVKAELSTEEKVLENVEKSEDSMENLLDMYEESFNRFREGEIVTGTIIALDKEHVLVDIGYKSEGRISINEFKDEHNDININLGDSVEVMVEKWDDEEERVILSKEKAEQVKVWEDIKKTCDQDETIEGEILNRVKGGFTVDIGVQAFLPGSQADLRPIRNLDEMVGKRFDFKILKYNRKRNNVVLSRRILLEKVLE